MHITTNIVCSNSAHGEVYSIQHYVIKFVSDLRSMVFPTNRTDGTFMLSYVLRDTMVSLKIKGYFVQNFVTDRSKEMFP